MDNRTISTLLPNSQIWSICRDLETLENHRFGSVHPNLVSDTVYYSCNPERMVSSLESENRHSRNSILSRQSNCLSNVMRQFDYVSCVG